uniref:Uncharacterized protein n=1 Tax=Anguilla anguilla TaxID=7936 RepID=A0A0E9QVH8_ANGAN
MKHEAVAEGPNPPGPATVPLCFLLSFFFPPQFFFSFLFKC